MNKVKKRVLFVCLGNICRSPAAEGVMKSIVSQEGIEDEFEIDSAGIGDWHVGELPDSRMRKCGVERGYHFNSHARQFTLADFNTFDHIYVMDHQNIQSIKAKASSKADTDKVEMLADYLISYPAMDIIPDPYYGGIKDFNYTLDLIEEACAQLFISLKNKQ